MPQFSLKNPSPLNIWYAQALAARDQGAGYTVFLGRPMTAEEEHQRKEIQAALFRIGDPWMRVDMAASLAPEALEELAEEDVREEDWEDLLELVWDCHVRI